MITREDDAPSSHSSAGALTVDIQQLVRSHQSFVARILARAGVAQRDVPDLVQEVFIVAHRRLPEWQGRAKLSTWLYRIALRVASDHRRRAYQRRETLPGLDSSTLEAPTAPLTTLERHEQLTQLSTALDQLSHEHKQTIVGYELDDLTVAELAEQSQVPQKTVYSRLHAARRILRRLLIAQGWTLLVRIIWNPKRCLAAWRALRLPLIHAPLLCALVLAPIEPPQPTAASTTARVKHKQQPIHNPQLTSPTAANTLPPTAATSSPPTATTAPKHNRVSRKQPTPKITAPSQSLATPTELKVIHLGSIERPEGQLPFNFERIEEPATPRISLRGPRDPAEALLRELL